MMTEKSDRGDSEGRGVDLAIPAGDRRTPAATGRNARPLGCAHRLRGALARAGSACRHVISEHARLMHQATEE